MRMRADHKMYGKKWHVDEDDADGCGMAKKKKKTKLAVRISNERRSV